MKENLREIIFKAKRTDDRKWIEGYYQRRYDSSGRPEHLMFNASSNIAWEYAEVDRMTLCQYTGIAAYWDDEEKEVWEHDIVEVEYNGKKVRAEVAFECGMFILASNEFPDSYIPLFDALMLEDIYWLDAKVLGNIFDNPELLMEEEHERDTI